MIDKVFKAVGHYFIKRSHAWQTNSPLRNLNFWNVTSNEAGHLCIDGIDCFSLVENYGSPLLVVNKKQLKKDADLIKNALKQARPGSKVLYSYKTNCIPGVLEQIHSMGLGAEVISPYELWLAEKLKVDCGHIVFNGVNKTDDSLQRAVRLKLLAINIDHMDELDRLMKFSGPDLMPIRLGVRLGFDADSQFGLNVENGEAMAVCKKILANSEKFTLNSLHFNVVSSAQNSRTHRQALALALEFFYQLKQQTGMDIEYLNIGGGFGVPTTKVMSRMEYAQYRIFNSMPRPPQTDKYQPVEKFIQDIVSDIRVFCTQHRLTEPKLLLEPGRFVTSRSQVLLTRVNAIKERPSGKIFAITETGRISMTYPCDYEYHEIFVANKMQATMDTNYTIVGRICTSADWMMKNRLLPRLDKGDLLAVMDAGAYFFSYSANFSFPRPAVVMVDEQEPVMLRNEETFDHLTAMDQLSGL
jgi:diaminopimelate decarboxylase